MKNRKKNCVRKNVKMCRKNTLCRRESFFFKFLNEILNVCVNFHEHFFYNRIVYFTTNQVEIQPAERETIFSDELRPSDPRNVGPCGGFSTQYACMCDYHGVPYRLVDVLHFSFLIIFTLCTFNQCHIIQFVRRLNS